MPFAPAVVERTMKVQEVLMKAVSGQLTWLEAEDILGWQPRTLRRWRLRYRPSRRMRRARCTSVPPSGSPSRAASSLCAETAGV